MKIEFSQIPPEQVPEPKFRVVDNDIDPFDSLTMTYQQMADGEPQTSNWCFIQRPSCESG